MPDHPTGVPIQLEPLVTRVLAPNPSAFTGTGTQTYLVGTTDLAVIDPGPDDLAHLDALLRAIDGRPVSAIVITHHHRDHSPASRPLAAATGAPIVGAAPTFVSDDGPGADAAFDGDYHPGRALVEGDQIAGGGWTLCAVATPGHTSSHLAFALPETGALFSGDHVMGWSTTIVSPPDGDMAAYMASLDKLLGRDNRVFYPGHGEQVDNPRRLVRGLLGHRKQREGQILRLLDAGAQPLGAMTARMYAGLDPRLLPAAERSVLAHLYNLRSRGLVGEGEGAWAKNRLTFIVLAMLAVAVAFWWQGRRVTRAEENVGLDTSRTITEVFARASALKVADLHGEAVAAGMDARSCGLFTATQKTRAPYEVAYLIDLSRLPASAYRWNEQARVMAVDVPDVIVGKPNIDAALAKTSQTGACVSRRAGQAMQLQVAQRLRGAVARSANSPAHLQQARDSARAAVAALVRGPLAAAGIADVRVAVRFPGEAKPAALSVEHWNESRPLADALGTH